MSLKKDIPEDVVKKVKSLLKSYTGCLKINSEHEAMNAFRLAKRLMEKHHLDMMMLSEVGESDSDITHKKIDKCSVYAVPLWLYNIINTVCNICNTRCILNKDKQSNGYIHIDVVFVCRCNDMDHVFGMYMFFKKTTYRLANKHVKEIKGNHSNWRSFAEGFTSRLLERSRIFNSVVPTNDTNPDSVEDIVRYDPEDPDFIDEDEDENVDIGNEFVDKNATNCTLQKYLKETLDKIDEYINTKINDVRRENTSRKSKVLVDSYESGRKEAEKQNMKFVDKSHQLTSQQQNKGKTK